MDPNNNRMQMWMKTTRGTLTPRNEQRVSFKTHCADTGPKRADLPRGDRNEFPAARLPCTLMKPERRSPFGGESSPPPHRFSSRNVKTENALDGRGLGSGGNSLEKGDNEFSQLRISSRQFPHRSLASAPQRPGDRASHRPPGGITSDGLSPAQT